MKMKKKTWLITGISSGLGKALAEAVIERGDFVIGTFRNAEQVDAFNALHKGQAYSIQLDLSEVDSIDDALNALLEIYPSIDVLVNNAGVGFTGAVEEASVEEVRNVFEVNFFGTLRVTQKILPVFRNQRSGHVIQISSHGGQKAFAGFGIYNASKFALEGFSEALAQEISPLGIKLTIVEPGPFRTNFAGKGLNEAKELISDYSDTAGVFRFKLRSVHNKQEGDPVKAAKAIIDISNSENPPLRMPLGKIALMTIGMKLESVQSDLDRGRTIAENAVF